MLKQLELHGFKTFAGKATFQFADGITAIVGPNGSGKSNLADGVRWILGEQRPAVLRARRSEDMIFSGTERRARMGMAQGFLTIDNSDGLLPIDFSEVVVGRRIYRNGESEYLINGNKVRLRDVHELLAHIGIGANAYTVIGQGLVDAALALRAEERRQLFEDAAGLGAYQGKREEVLRRLGQTEEHLVRIRDIIAEIEPRLVRLRRQAERASEYRDLATTLEEMLRQLYGYRWAQAVHSFNAAESVLDEARAQLRRRETEVETIEEQVEELRARQAELREALERSRRERGQLRGETERLHRERAVIAEREQSYQRQRVTLHQEQESLEAEAAELRGRLDGMNQEGDRLQAGRAAAQTTLAEAQAQLAGAENVRAGHRRALDEARRTLGKLTARQGELAQRQGTLGERQRQLEAEIAGHQQVLISLTERLEQRTIELEQLGEEVTRTQHQREAFRQERATLQHQRKEALTTQREAQAALHEVQRDLAQVVARRDLLARLRSEGAGYGTGVRALLGEAARFGSSLLGPVADHMRVPQPLSLAVSVALGESLQAVVLREGDGRIRNWLYERKVGRVTLLPLSELRGPDSRIVPREEGVLGRAADLVQADDPTLLEHLLGDWLVVESWATVDTFNGASDGWNLVTLDGQVRLRKGAIIAGHGGNGDALLAQSREWAELPGHIVAVEARQAEAKAALDEATERLQAVEERLGSVEREVAESERTVQRAEAALQRERRDAEKVQQERGWRQGLVQKAEEERDTLQRQAETLGGELTALQQEHSATEEQIGVLEQQLEASHPAALRQAVEQARTRVAVADEQLAGWERSRTALRETLQRLTQRQAAKAQQATQLEAEAATLAQRSAALEAEAQQVEATLQAALDHARPLDREQSQNESRLAELEEQHLAARRRRQEREEAAHTARLSLQAIEERLLHLREQIEADLGAPPVNDEGEDERPHSPGPSIEELLTSLPKVTVLPDTLENDIRRLRRRISNLGPINPEAPAEYAELQQRHTFLTEQSDDLTRASHDLRRIVAELDQVMRERFVKTFHAINEAFEGYFTRLFNGGQARMELTEPDNPMNTGVEIIARPPGKRAQSISLLSGGERALTAAALIFAILHVSPAPFCVLDEVDAMLDEANVGRFSETLAELASNTQFIVVTHNRGTIEVARAIYGISQSDPGISEVISLQLEEAIRASKH